ncbi:MAG: carboxylesterase family protein [Sphaerochaetaceae bacterium]|nr:carboxylesterase family protein [Sphaerochaetaceae bacterium]
MEPNEVRATTSLGMFVGIRSSQVCSWKGIPYAKPIKNSLLFSQPVPETEYDSPVRAVSFSGICPQRSILRTDVSENCLTLNIWSPECDEKKRPVLFFIHGGAFSHGAGSESYYRGEYLAKTWDIVVVTVNYRMGIFGCLDFSTVSDEFTSNNCIRDVLAALRWVGRHIGSFGGNPELITIMGQSAGGTMVSTLSVMEEAKGLFQRAVIMSGGPTQLQSLDVCRKTTDAFLNFSGLKKSTDLTSATLYDLIDLQKRFMKYYNMGSATFRITVDNKLVRHHPIPAAQSSSPPTVPLLIGTTKEEMGFMSLKVLTKLLVDVERIIDEGLRLEHPAVRDLLYERYRRQYGPQRAKTVLYTDLLFRISSVWFAEAAGEHVPAWMYRFDYETIALRMNGMHSFHATDLPYVFGTFKSVLVQPMFLFTMDMSEVYAVAQAIQSDVVTFMKTGKLDWPQCKKSDTPAKCYDKVCTVQPMVDQIIKDLYDITAYKSRSFSGDESHLL